MEHSITNILHGIIETLATCASVAKITETWQEIILVFLNASPLKQNVFKHILSKASN